MGIRQKSQLPAKQRELAASWDKLKKEQSAPLFDKNKYGTAKVKSKIPRAADTLAFHRDRLTTHLTSVRPDGMTSVVHNLHEGIEPRKMDPEEYERREKAAREVKHCIMPLHKGGYILVTDEDMVKQMGKKTA